MNTIFRIGIIGLFTLLFFSCDKREETIKPIEEIEEGVYSGVFTVTYFVGIPESWDRESGTATLELKDGRYTCTGNPNRVPAGGSGSYTISNGKITFNAEGGWTADFDWNLILMGEYDYTFDGKRFVISADKNEVGNYKYDLTKQ